MSQSSSILRARYSGKTQFVSKSIEPPIFEQDELIRETTQKDLYAKGTVESRLKKKPYGGLYAHEIWQRLRSESTSKVKFFDLSKELQNSMDSYVRNELFKKNFKIKNAVRNDDELTRSKHVLDMQRIKEVKAYRNEIELMYRSSKMNEDKYNVLRADSPLPDLNDKYGNESIQKYLPPLENQTKHRTIRQLDPTLEFTLSPLMRTQYEENLTRKKTEQKTKVVHTVIENEAHDKSMRGSQSVKMVFLSDKEATDPDFRISALDQIVGGEKSLINDELLSNEHITYKQNDSADSTNEFKNVDECPPLSLNALIEYKRSLEAPGEGSFNQGKIKTFKII